MYWLDIFFGFDELGAVHLAFFSCFVAVSIWLLLFLGKCVERLGRNGFVITERSIYCDLGQRRTSEIIVRKLRNLVYR